MKVAYFAGCCRDSKRAVICASHILGVHRVRAASALVPASLFPLCSTIFVRRVDRILFRFKICEQR